jgi:NAD(P) transhydrogenase subunit alpha
VSSRWSKSLSDWPVIIDLAAATGGTTEYTKNNETVIHNGVSIVGNSNLAATMPSDASKMYGKNILNFLQLMINKEGKFNLNFEDDLVLGTCMVHGGEIINDRIKQVIGN